MKLKKEGRLMMGIPALTANMLEIQRIKINKERAKLNKEPLTKVAIIALAIENLTIEMGVSK